ncbi:MAG: tetratricopeptide repeat protein [Proteobacteria bacterium]|nr:tetratricopeptide repeat protein [Pseudomonadota bacterium]
MTGTDLRGNPCGTRSAAARDAAETALWRMMSFYDTPLADLDAASHHDPAWALPHVMRAGFLLSLTEPAQLAAAGAHLRSAQARSAGAPARERAHLEAVQAVHEGRWQAACRIWDELLLDHPRDALALQWAQLWDFYRGDAANLRLRPARALPDWDEADPLYPNVLSLHAFGLEENNLYPQAEEAGRRALERDPRVPWAVHAVAHVMEMQGRFEEGGAWLRQHQPAWAEGNGFACHLWWHSALFRLEAMDTEGALRLLDRRLAGDALQITLQRVDAAAMLWRLHLLGLDMRSRCAELLAGWELGGAQAGWYAFNDVHAVLALLGAGEPARAEAWVARCAERALCPDDARRSNHAMAREAGLPLMRGLIAFARGEHAAAAEALYAVRGSAQRFGGSHAQRDLIDQTALAAAAQGGGRAIGRALLNERLMAKPASPLTLHWRARLAEGARRQAD